MHPHPSQPSPIPTDPDPSIRLHVIDGSADPDPDAALLPDRPAHLHRMRVLAAARALPGDAVVSHVSAACLWRLPICGIQLDGVPPHVTRPGTGSSVRRRLLLTKFGPLDPVDVTRIDGVPVTSAARTVIDLGCTSALEPALVSADAALRAGLVSAGDLAAALQRAAGRYGVEAARAAVELADPRSRSVGESRSRAAIRSAWLPDPDRHVEIRSAEGDSLGHVMFCWRRQRVIGRYDGAVPHVSRSVAASDSADEHRSARLQAHGWTVVRWTWYELADGRATAKIADTLEARDRAGGRPMRRETRWPSIR